MVRSNSFDSIGFVSNVNRIIVALSRARHGLYIVGNGKLLQEQSDEWFKTLKHLEQQEAVVDAIQVHCPTHEQHTMTCSTGKDFEFFLSEGCPEECTHVYDCGHKCLRKCHMDDFEHNKQPCQRICGQTMPCKHKCEALCHDGEDHPLCEKTLQMHFPTCKHNYVGKCGDEKKLMRCRAKCGKKLNCGHACSNECNKCKLGCPPCKAECKKRCPNCKEMLTYSCGTAVPECTNNCKTVLPCGHECSGVCGECTKNGYHSDCTVQCSKTLICGCQCSSQHSCSDGCLPCMKQCKRRCPHGKTCNRKCCDICIECKEQCLYKCDCIEKPKCNKLCFEYCSRAPCHLPCSRKLQCGHACKGICGEPCPICVVCNPWMCSICHKDSNALDDSDCLYMLPDCKHTFCVECLDSYLYRPQDETIQVGYVCCPLCRTAVFCAPRFEVPVKMMLRRIESLKRFIRKKEQEQEEETEEVMELVSRDASWYCCPKGHYYWVGNCGNPTETGKCIECQANIGGIDHVPLPNNKKLSNK